MHAPSPLFRAVRGEANGSEDLEEVSFFEAVCSKRLFSVPTHRARKLGSALLFVCHRGKVRARQIQSSPVAFLVSVGKGKTAPQSLAGHCLSLRSPRVSERSISPQMLRPISTKWRRMEKVN